MDGNNERLIEVDYLRGMAALFVVIGHAFIIYPIDINQVLWCRVLRYCIYSFHMGLFFCLSGYVYSCTKYKGYIFKKIKRIIIPYLFFSFSNLIVHIWGNSLVNEDVSIKEGLLRIVSGEAEWFLPTIFIIYVAYPFIDKFLKLFWQKILFIIVSVAIILFVSRIPGVIYNTLFYMPFFVVGNIFRQCKVLERLNKQRAVGMVILAVVMSAIGVYCDLFGGLASPICKYLKGFGIITCLVISTMAISRKSTINESNIISKGLQMFSKYSLQIYLLNGYPLTILRYIICSKLGISNPLIIVSALTFGIVVSTVLVSICCERIKVLAFLMGLKYVRKRAA